MMCIDVYIELMDSREVIKRIKAEGWFQVAQEGDHLQFKHPTKPGRVTASHIRLKTSLKARSVA